MQDNKVDIYNAKLEPKLNFLLALLGEYNFLALCNEFGGSSLYIPKYETIVRQIRNNKIIEEFKNGVSLSQLRKKYNLSETALRKIIYKN